MTTVETARGPVDTAALGKVLMHEHVFILSHDFHVNYPDVVGFDEELEVAAAVERLDELAATGVGTIVDLTVVGLGRDVRLVARVAEQTVAQHRRGDGLLHVHRAPHLRARPCGHRRVLVADMLAELVRRPTSPTASRTPGCARGSSRSRPTSRA